MKIKKFLTKATAVILSLSIAVGGACVLSNVLTAEATYYSDKSNNMLPFDDFEYNSEKDAYINKDGDTIYIYSKSTLSNYNIINYGTIIVCPGLFYNEINVKNITNYGTITVMYDYPSTVTITESITNYGIINDPNSKLSGKIITPQKVTNPATAGDTPVTLNGSTIPEPTYTVTIPTEIEFGDVSRVSVNDTDANKLAKTINYDVTVAHKSLYANEKNVTVTMTSDFTLTGASDTLDFELFNAEDTQLKTGDTIITTSGDDTTQKTETRSMYATLDKSDIKVAGDYAGTVTFTVAMQDK